MDSHLLLSHAFTWIVNIFVFSTLKKPLWMFSLIWIATRMKKRGKRKSIQNRKIHINLYKRNWVTKILASNFKIKCEFFLNFFMNLMLIELLKIEYFTHSFFKNKKIFSMYKIKVLLVEPFKFSFIWILSCDEPFQVLFKIYFLFF